MIYEKGDISNCLKIKKSLATSFQLLEMKRMTTFGHGHFWPNISDISKRYLA